MHTTLRLQRHLSTLALLGAAVLVTKTAEARPPQGFLPPGVAKKAAAGEELPPPWQSGEFMPPGLAKKQEAVKPHGKDIGKALKKKGKEKEKED